MKAILMSIQPKWCDLIADGKKTVEVRKTKPNLDVPFKVYMYCTKPYTASTEDNFYIYLPPHDTPKRANGKVIGEFECDSIITAKCGNYVVLVSSSTQLDALDLMDYADEKTVYGYHISDLVIYDKPKGLSEFERLRKTKFGYEPIKLTRPPQSWCYVEEVQP